MLLVLVWILYDQQLFFHIFKVCFTNDLTFSKATPSCWRRKTMKNASLWGTLPLYIYNTKGCLLRTPGYPPLKQASYWYGGHMGYLNNYKDVKGDIGVQDKRQISNECQWNGIWHPDISTGLQNGNRSEHTEICLETGGNSPQWCRQQPATHCKTGGNSMFLMSLRNHFETNFVSFCC